MEPIRPDPPLPKPFPKFFLALPLLLLALLGLLYWRGMTLDPNSQPSPVLGKPFPAFGLPSLDEPSKALDATAFRGPALVNVWASWCVACREENPDLLSLRQKGVRIYGVDYLDLRPEAQAWLEREGNPFAAVVMDVDGKLGRDLGLFGAPETYLIDADGIVRHRRSGRLDEATIAKALQMAGPSAQAPQ